MDVVAEEMVIVEATQIIASATAGKGKWEMKIADLTLVERETHLSQSADNHDEWEMYTDDPVWISRMNRLGIVAKRTTAAGGKFYLVPDSQITIRKKRRAMTEEELVRVRERFARSKSGTPSSSSSLRTCWCTPGWLIGYGNARAALA